MIRLMLYTTIILITVGCSGLFTNYPDLGRGYKFIHEGKYGLSIANEKNTIVIQQHVLKYKFDSIFVIASQRPVNSIFGRDNMTYSEFNKMFKNSSFKQYWIIDKTKRLENIGFDSIRNHAKYSNVYGPFQIEEYLQKHKELGVPKELRLDFKEEI